jgi:hypothetical protein
MKILYLVHQFYPDAYQGTEKFVLQLAQHCQAAGHEVKVITYSTRAQWWSGNNGRGQAPLIVGASGASTHYIPSLSPFQSARCFCF